jgi:hypothetical protein
MIRVILPPPIKPIVLSIIPDPSFLGKITAFDAQAHFVFGRPSADDPADRELFKAVRPEMVNGLFNSNVAASLAASSGI